MKKFLGVVFLLALSVTLPCTAWTQTQITSGVIQGTVVDPSGGVVPDATVEVKNLDTNLTRTLSTDGDGRFVALQLPPGRYTVTISKQGFATVVQENVNLTVGQAIVLPITLKVSATAERIVVTDTPTVDTVKTESSSTLNDKTVSTTPVLGRKFEDLLTLTPGVSVVQGPDGDEINFNGQRGIFTNISLDGGDYINGFFGEQVGGQRAAIDITLDAVKEFQVVASGANAEFGRTAGGVVNVITKSGTNDVHGSVFHFQRHENLSANTSDGRSLTDFHREQFGGTIGGPIVRDKAFFFGAVERITGNLQRPNLSEQIGTTACPVATPVVPTDEALINTNPDCQRLALINFIRTSRSQEEGLPVRRPLWTTATLAKLDWNVSENNLLTFSYNFNWSKKNNETFDVATYGNSANGIEGDPTRINVLNFNLFSTLSPTMVNEGHFTYARETRPRRAVASSVPADTGVGFGPSFRFGNPFFLNPNINELFWRSQLKDNFSLVWGRHTVKFGGEWIHSVNDQVFRGFFTGRYLFDSVAGFLRYASAPAAGGFGPNTVACSDGTFVTFPTLCTAPATPTNGPLLFYLQDGIPTGLVNIPPGASNISNNEFALFIQDKWQIWPNFVLNYGLRWEAQTFPDPVVAPSQTAYGPHLSNPAFPSDGTLHNQNKMFQPRLGFAWDWFSNRKSVLRASWGIFNARQNMLTQVGSITTNGAQQFSAFCSTFTVIIDFPCFGSASALPTWPGVVPPPPFTGIQLFSGVRVFSKDYANPRIYSTNVAFEQELAPDWALYFDFTHSKGIHLTRFVDRNNGAPDPAAACPGGTNIPPGVCVPMNGNTVSYPGPAPFAPELLFLFTAESSAKSLYRGFTVGMRKRFSHKYQLEWNYAVSKDLDDDSNERDPFTERHFNRFDFSKDYNYSDRDIRHKFNFYTYAELPWGFEANVRVQARSAQPITHNPRVASGVDRGRNNLRKNNEYFSFDWRLLRPFKWGDRYAITPIIEMFNTFNNDNNVNPLIVPALFNFDGFLRQGVGDPLQVQIAVKFTF